jgi:GDP-L-fucose synthase
MMQKDCKIYLAGHNGMVGSAILRKLKGEGFNNLIFSNSKSLDLREQKSVSNYINENKPDLIINAAAVVGGIWANNHYPYQFLLDNMLIQNNLLKAAVDNNTPKFIFLGSSCVYPKFSKQPIKEDYLLSGPLEDSNQWYAIAKISGLKLIESIRLEHNYDYISLMPTNLYGPNDNFDPLTSHVLPGMIAKFHNAKINKFGEVTLWGDGSPLREFLHVDDLAEAIIFLLDKNLEHSIYNVGSDDEISIIELSKIISEIIDFKGEIIWDKKFPNGTPRKRLDSNRINSLGWETKIKLKDGIKEVYKFYLNKYF